MAKRAGIRVQRVENGLAAFTAGLRKNDLIVSVNGHGISDEFDFRFNAACDRVRLVVVRNGKSGTITVDRRPGVGLGVEFVQPKVRRCANRCVFCFIDQMPKGLRKSLYVKDEDIGHSFANGNYVTLASTPYRQLERAASLGLSPLYVSVHATIPEVRRRMLGNRRAFDVMDQLKFLAKSAVSFHTQIVVCPGFNDGAVLAKSVSDLLSLRRGLLSVAIVPVGLTKHRRVPLTPVSADAARTIVTGLSRVGEIDRRKLGFRRLFCADELFIKAGIPIPPRAYYEDYPQIENGVGLVRTLLEEWKNVKRGFFGAAQARLKSKKRRAKTIVIVTAESAAGILSDIASDIMRLSPNAAARVCPVKNEYFGDSVTVAGLLTGRDIARTLRRIERRVDHAVIPAVVFNRKGHTLDGWSLRRIEKSAGIPVSAANSVTDILSFL